MALFLDVRVGESIDIDNGRCVITLEEKDGRRARLKCEADQSVPIRQLKPRTSPIESGLSMRHAAGYG